MSDLVLLNAKNAGTRSGAVAAEGERGAGIFFQRKSRVTH
jgi:hypothetical protein